MGNPHHQARLRWFNLMRMEFFDFFHLIFPKAMY
jgi:hypothetical protein